MPSASPIRPTSTRLGDAVVDRVHEGDAVAERREPLPRDAQGIRVAVETDEADAGKALEERLGVAAHAERGVDEHGAVALERGGEQLDAALEQDGGVDVAQVHDVGARCPSPLIPIRSTWHRGSASGRERLGVRAEGLRTGPESPPAPVSA